MRFAPLAMPISRDIWRLEMTSLALKYYYVYRRDYFQVSILDGDRNYIQQGARRIGDSYMPLPLFHFVSVFMKNKFLEISIGRGDIVAH